MKSTKEIAWLAGLLEGEGCFAITGNCPHMILQTTDLDVVEKARDIMDNKTSIGTYNRSGNEEHKGWKDNSYGKKDKYRVQINGDIAAQWMMTIYTFLGSRRRAKVQEILEIYSESKPRYNRIYHTLDAKELAIRHLVNIGKTRKQAEEIVKGALSNA